MDLRENELLVFVHKSGGHNLDFGSGGGGGLNFIVFSEHFCDGIEFFE
jgi:hypothetical protein